MQTPYVPVTTLRPWSSGLFDCFSDIESCLCVWCCTPCAYGQLVNMLNRGFTGGMCGDCGSCCVYWCLMGFGVPCCVSCGTRSQIRMRYTLSEEPCGDCLVHCCCEPCALCQEIREVKHQLANSVPHAGIRVVQAPGQAPSQYQPPPQPYPQGQPQNSPYGNPQVPAAQAYPAKGGPADGGMSR